MKHLLIPIIYGMLSVACPKQPPAIVQAALSFVGCPYKGGTLEVNDTEQLVVNLSEFDCTTLVETCLALALADSTKPGDFRYQLQRIRYRGGIIDGYTSRLHYISDWVADNQARGIVEDKTCALGGEPFSPRVYYMTENHHEYPHLKNNIEAIKTMREIERKINRNTHDCYIPKARITELADSIADGDILFFTTSIHGLDVQHAGIAYRTDGRLTFIHASSRAGKVIVEPLSLSEYCAKQGRITGIMIIRN